MKKLLLTIVLAVAITNVFGTTYYWVGGSGTWGTSASFAATSGGTGSALSPATGDEVIFDSNSGSSPTITVGANTVIAKMTAGCGGTLSFTGAGTFTVSTTLTFANNTKISSANQKTFGLGNGGAFNMVGCDANNYFTGTTGNGYLQVATTGSVDLYVDPTFTWFNIALNKGITNLYSNLTTSRLGFSTNSPSLVLKPNVVFTITSNSSSTLSSTGTIDASASGSKVVIKSSNTTAGQILNASRQIFSGTINHLEMNSSTYTYTPFSALTVNNLTLTAGTINNTTNNITINNNGTITRTSGTLSAVPNFGTGMNVVYSGAVTTSNELPSSVNSLIVGANVSLNAALTIAGSLTLTSGTLTNSTNNITFNSGGTTPVEIIRTAGSLSVDPIFTSTVNVTYNNSTSTTSSRELPFATTQLNNLTVNNEGGVIINGDRTANGTLNLIAGTLAVGNATNSRVFTFKGSSIIRTNGTLDAGIVGASGTQGLTFANTAPLTLPAGLFSGSIYNLTINGAGGVTLGDATTIQNTLTLTSGTLTTGANTLTLNGSTSGSGTIETASNGTIVYGGASAQTISNLASNAVNSLTIDNAAGVAINSNITAGTLTVNAGKILNVSAGKHLTVSNSMTNNGTLNLRSTETDGTATIVTPATIGGTTGATNVEQYLGTARNWYISSPLTGATAPSGYTYYQRDVAGSSWTSQPFTAGNSFEKGKGYIALPGSTGATLTFTASGANHLNTGDVDVTLSAAGFNLIGNPYPSHLAWTQAFVDDAANAAKIDPTIWVRTNSGASNTGGWSFLTYNAHSGEAAPSTSILTGGVIPPMQAFWVKAKSASTLTLDSKLTRSHQSSNPLKAPASKNNERQRVRLQINNGTTTDEALIYFDGAASNDFDPFDSPKFSDSNSVTQIYTTAGAEKLVINGMNSIQLDQQIALGLVPGNAASFSIRANELSNIPADVKVILKDNVTQVETDLTDGSAVYQFSAETTNPDRFSVIFRSSSTTTALNNNNLSGTQIYWNNEQGLTFKTNDEKLVGSTLAVYNSLGQQLLSKKIAGTTMNINFSCAPDMYFVKINNVTTKVIVK